MNYIFCPCSQQILIDYRKIYLSGSLKQQLTRTQLTRLSRKLKNWQQSVNDHFLYMQDYIMISLKFSFLSLIIIYMFGIPKYTRHPKAESKLYRITLKQFKPFLLLFFLCLQSTVVLSCYNIKANNTQCQICQSTTSFTCLYLNSSNQQSFNSSTICAKYCCDSNIFGDTSIYSICNNANEYSKFNLPILVPIIAAIVGIVILLIVCIRDCLKNKNKAEKLIFLNLTDAQLNKLGPQIQDFTLECPICLYDHCNMRTKCRHSFHQQCLLKWINKQQRCPICKSKCLNPTLLYCTQCFKMSQACLIQKNISVKQEKGGYKCKICKEKDEEICDISIQSKQQGKSGMKTQQLVESQTQIVRN